LNTGLMIARTAFQSSFFKTTKARSNSLLKISVYNTRKNL
jgi:hypothetical protein